MGAFGDGTAHCVGTGQCRRYQNDASAKIKPAPLGASIIRNTFVLPWEGIRDSIFSGKTIGFSNRSLFHNDREFLLTRDYRPLLGSDGEIVGIISMGWSRQAPAPRNIPIFPLLFAR